MLWNYKKHEERKRMKKIILASDLDQTLIYSNRFIEDASSDILEKVQDIEVYNGKNISFISKFTKIEIDNLILNNQIIPVTTRTIEQFKRISLFDDKLKYAITSNGGNILKNGEIFLEWQNIIEKQMKFLKKTKEEVYDEYDKIKSDDWSSALKLADNLFYYAIIDRDKINLEILEKFKLWLDKYDWNLSIQGRKLYLVPKCIDKWNALEYLKNIENFEFIVCSGDSKLDFQMMEKSDLGIIPKHGKEAIENLNEIHKHIEITSKEGIFASEEIIQKFKDQMK